MKDTKGRHRYGSIMNWLPPPPIVSHLGEVYKKEVTGVGADNFGKGGGESFYAEAVVQFGESVNHLTQISLSMLHSITSKLSTLLQHRWELPVLHYHKIMSIYLYPILVVFAQFFLCIIFINDLYMCITWFAWIIFIYDCICHTKK